MSNLRGKRFELSIEFFLKNTITSFEILERNKKKPYFYIFNLNNGGLSRDMFKANVEKRF